jgi:hypothetical protein
VLATDAPPIVTLNLFQSLRWPIVSDPIADGASQEGNSIFLRAQGIGCLRLIGPFGVDLVRFSV